MSRVMVCPLDWGLGHATRCIPVIRELQRQNADVTIASSGSALQLLRKEFPGLAYRELPGYRPEYPVRIPMVLKMIGQLPKFCRTAAKEHRLTELWVKQDQIDIIISDNRYGCWSRVVKSVFITHQVNLLMTEGFGWLAPLVNYFGHRFIRKFSEVWIPDQPFSGLTAPFLSTAVDKQRFIGWLSRFEPGVTLENRYDVMGIASGPDPQRKIFFQLLYKELSDSGLRCLLVAGEPGNQYRRQEGNVEVVSHLLSAEMQNHVLSSSVIISRSGYSTVMDLIALEKKAIFIPTPQQPEQIYLARHLGKLGLAFCEDQERFSLKTALTMMGRIKSLNFATPDKTLMPHAITELLQHSRTYSSNLQHSNDH